MSGAPLDVLCLATGKVVDLKPARMQRRAVGDHDVLIEMQFCGICHTDLHHCKGDMVALTGATPYPAVPGHELAGIVKTVGSKVSKFSVGESIGVGCMVDSCGKCSACKSGEQQHCRNGQIATYGGRDKYGRAASPTGYTLGGYTNLFGASQAQLAAGLSPSALPCATTTLARAPASPPPCSLVQSSTKTLGSGFRAATPSRPQGR